MSLRAWAASSAVGNMGWIPFLLSIAKNSITQRRRLQYLYQGKSQRPGVPPQRTSIAGRYQALFCPVRTVDQGGTGQPVIIRIPGKHELAAFEAVNHHTGDFRTYRRTAVAAPYAPMTADPAGIHIVSRMDDDRSEERRVGKECRSRWSALQEKKKRDRAG